jgi:hypothetical protein
VEALNPVQAFAAHNPLCRGRFSSTHVPAKRCAALRNNGASGLDFDSPTVGWKYAGG